MVLNPLCNKLEGGKTLPSKKLRFTQIDLLRGIQAKQWFISEFHYSSALFLVILRLSLVGSSLVLKYGHR